MTKWGTGDHGVALQALLFWPPPHITNGGGQRFCRSEQASRRLGVSADRGKSRRRDELADQVFPAAGPGQALRVVGGSGRRVAPHGGDFAELEQCDRVAPRVATLAESVQRLLEQGFGPRAIFVIQRGLSQEEQSNGSAGGLPQRVPLPGRFL